MFCLNIHRQATGPALEFAVSHIAFGDLINPLNIVRAFFIKNAPVFIRVVNQSNRN